MSEQTPEPPHDARRSLPFETTANQFWLFWLFWTEIETGKRSAGQGRKGQTGQAGVGGQWRGEEPAKRQKKSAVHQHLMQFVKKLPGN